MFCTSCGKEVSEATVFCPYCGKQLKKVAPVQAAEAATPTQPVAPANMNVQAAEVPVQPTAVQSGAQDTTQPAQPKNNTVLMVVVIVLIVAVVAGVLFARKIISNKDSSAELQAQLEAMGEDNAEEDEDEEEAAEDASDATTGASAADQSAEETTGSGDAMADLIASAGATTTSEYVLKDSSYRALSKSDLEGLTADQLRIARNEIYARHGRRFQDETLQAYFDGKSWYHGTIDPDDFTDDMLSEIEKANKDLIVEYEGEMGYR